MQCSCLSSWCGVQKLYYTRYSISTLVFAIEVKKMGNLLKLLHYAMVLATCLTILLQQKVHEKLSSVTWNNKSSSTFCNVCCNAAKKFYMLLEGVMLGNISCKLSCKSETEMQDKLQEILASVTAPIFASKKSHENWMYTVMQFIFQLH